MKTIKKFLLVGKQPEEDTHTTPWGRVWSHGADVMTTWKRHGFVPPSETRTDYCFKANRDAAEQ